MRTWDRTGQESLYEQDRSIAFVDNLSPALQPLSACRPTLKGPKGPRPRLVGYTFTEATVLSTRLISYKS